MNDESVYNVRQRGFEFITPKDVQKRFVTRGVNLCTVLIGVKQSNEQAFMCHIDIPTTTNALSKLMDLIRAENNEKLDGFELSAVSLFPPFYRVLTILSLSLIAISVIRSVYSAPIILFICWLVGWAQFKCWWTVHKYFKTQIKWRSPPKRIVSDRPRLSVGVGFDITAPDQIEIFWDLKKDDLSPWKPKCGRYTAVRTRNEIDKLKSCLLCKWYMQLAGLVGFRRQNK